MPFLAKEKAGRNKAIENFSGDEAKIKKQTPLGGLL